MRFTAHLLSYFLILSFTQSIFAARMYKYQDNQGNWHYTDKKPTGDIETQEIRMKASNEKALFKKIWVKEGIGMNPSLSVINNYFGPIQAKILVKCKKCTASPAREVTLLVDGNSEKVAMTINPETSNWSDEYDIQVAVGDPDAVPAPEAVYGLPIPMESFFLITQGFDGEFSHEDEFNKYAIDIDMPIGTPVLAARAGIVMAIEEGYKTAGLHQDFADKVNVIYILHEDGTIALYAHLDMHSSQVKIGHKVDRGGVIARSGNTGFSTGPHLHFTVQKNLAMANALSL